MKNILKAETRLFILPPYKCIQQFIFVPHQLNVTTRFQKFACIYFMGAVILSSVLYINTLLGYSLFIAQVLGDRIPPFFGKKKFPVFFFLFGIFVINLCYIIREISLFHIIREISLFHIIREISLFHIIREISVFLPVYYPAPATININILEGN